MSDPLLDKMQQLMAKYQTPPPFVTPAPTPAPEPPAADALPLLTDLVRLGDAATRPHAGAMRHDMDHTASPGMDGGMDGATMSDQPPEPQSPYPPPSLDTDALEQMAQHILRRIETRLHDEFQPLAHALVRQAVDDALSESLRLMQDQIATLVRASVRDTLHEHGISVHTDQQPV